MFNVGWRVLVLIMSTVAVLLSVVVGIVSEWSRVEADDDPYFMRRSNHTKYIIFDVLALLFNMALLVVHMLTVYSALRCLKNSSQGFRTVFTIMAFFGIIWILAVVMIATFVPFQYFAATISPIICVIHSFTVAISAYVMHRKHIEFIVKALELNPGMSHNQAITMREICAMQKRIRNPIVVTEGKSGHQADGGHYSALQHDDYYQLMKWANTLDCQYKASADLAEIRLVIDEMSRRRNIYQSSTDVSPQILPIHQFAPLRLKLECLHATDHRHLEFWIDRLTVALQQSFRHIRDDIVDEVVAQMRARALSLELNDESRRRCDDLARLGCRINAPSCARRELWSLEGD